MGAFLFFILLFSSIFVDIEGFQANCKTVNCGYGAPDIRFPFRVKTQKPQQNCGHPVFELVCKDNNTVIHFPSYGDLIVKSISYSTQKINLLDPKNCVHEVFLNLNLSFTPFRYYYVVSTYTYLNCSSRLSPSFSEVTCLSGYGHHVYTVESSLTVPVSCRVVKTIAIPFAYSPYLSDNSFGLGLTWNLPGCQDFKVKAEQVFFKSKAASFSGAHDRGFSAKHLVIGISIFIFVAKTLISIKVLLSKKLMNGEVRMGNHLEAEKSLGDYEAIKIERCYDEDIGEVSNQITTEFSRGNYGSAFKDKF